MTTRARGKAKVNAAAEAVRAALELCEQGCGVTYAAAMTGASEYVLRTQHDIEDRRWHLGYCRDLVARGMDAERIAAAMSIPLHYAEHLIHNSARMYRKFSGNAEGGTRAQKAREWAGDLPELTPEEKAEIAVYHAERCQRRSDVTGYAAPGDQE